MSGEIPSDFPYQPSLGSISGAQPKLALVRTADGKYVAGDGGIAVRFAICEEMVGLLTQYAIRKAKENPEWTAEFNVARTGRGLAQKVAKREWDVRSEEQVWVMKEVAKAFQAAVDAGALHSE